MLPSHATPAMRSHLGAAPRLPVCRRCQPPRQARRSLSSSTSLASPSSSSPSSSSTAAPPARLRFAPSPTGYLHLGGLRTALFNHLYARSLKAKWILRIEDTDQNRYVPGAVEALQRTLEWAKLDYDEGPGRSPSANTHGPYIQSERLDIYHRYVDRLLSSGKAYRDFRAEAVQDLDAPRVKGIPLREHYLPPDEDEARRLIKDGKPFVVRLKADTDAIHHRDLVYGDIHFPADPNRAGTEDPILLKSTGWPTYHLANVVDDHEMGITHVLRGEEWLPSLPKHLWLYRALGIEAPHFAHLPLLVNPDGSKLSKRTGDVRVEDYIQKGLEPEALNNFVALMGYNHNAARSGTEVAAGGSNYEVMSMQEMIDGFDIANVSHSRAAVDLPKLYFLNGRHMALKLDDAGATEGAMGQGQREMVDKVRPLLQGEFPETQDMDDRSLVALLQITKGTTETYLSFPTSISVLLRPPQWTSSDCLTKFHSTPTISRHYRVVVSSFLDLLSTTTAPATTEKNKAEGKDDEKITADEVSSLLKRLNKVVAQQVEMLTPLPEEEGGVKGKRGKTNVLLPLRFALTGRDKGPTLAEILCYLGRSRTKERLQLALKTYDQSDEMHSPPPPNGGAREEAEVIAAI